MQAEETKWRVGIIGISPDGLFLLERFSLRSDVQVIGVFDQNPVRSALANNLGCTIWEQLHAAIVSPETDALFFMGEISADIVAAALKHGKHVIIHKPWELSSDVLCELAQQSNQANRVATVSSLRRWSANFVSALLAKKTGRLGDLQTVRFTSCEQSIPSVNRPVNMLREFGYHWLDQLLLLVDGAPCGVFARHIAETGQQHEHGVWTTIEFANGCMAQIDLQSRSRLSHRTGWMLEGSAGSYRGDRLYTITTAGEIVDESLPRPIPLVDPFIDELMLARRGESTLLPTLTDASRVVKLIETIEQSAKSGRSMTL